MRRAAILPDDVAAIARNDNIAALAALRYEQAQIIDGRVMNSEAAATILQAVQAHVRALLACAPRPTPARVQPSTVDTAGMTDAEFYAGRRRPSRGDPGDRYGGMASADIWRAARPGRECG